MFNAKLEKQLLALLIHDKKFIVGILGNLSEDVFALPLHKLIFKTINNYYTKYSIVPSSDAFLATILEQNPKFAQEELKIFAETVYKVFSDDDIPDAAYIKDKIQNIVQVATLRKAISDAGVLLEQDKVEDIYQLLEKTRVITSPLANESKELVADFDTQLAALRTRETVSKISTGFPNVDIAVGGGLCVGELGVVLGGTNVGKSMFLDNLTANAALANKKVLLVSLELSEADMFARIISRLFMVPTNSLINMSKEDIDARKNYAFKQIQDKIHIVAYPTRSISLNQLSAITKRFEILHGKLDLLVLDSADNLRTKGSELRIELGETYQKLRGICGENNIGIWTCSQVNRTGMQAYRVKDIHASESIDKIFIADMVISLSQTEEEYPDRARLFIAKSRRTQKYQEIPLMLSYDMALVQEQPGFQLPKVLTADKVAEIKNTIGIVEPINEDSDDEEDE